MRGARRLSGIAALLAGALLAAATGAGAEPGRPWIERADARLAPPGDLLIRARIFVRDAGGEEEELEIDWARRRQQEVRHNVVEIREPAYLAGTTHWFRSQPGRGTERSVWSPRTGRLVRTSGLRPEDFFLGSLFALEDLGLVAPRPGIWGEAERGPEAVHIAVEPFAFFSGGLARVEVSGARWLSLELRDRAGQPFRQVRYGPPAATAPGSSGLGPPAWIEVEDRLSGASSRLEVVSHRAGAPLRGDLFDPVGQTERLRRGRGLDVPGPDAALPAPETPSGD